MGNMFFSPGVKVYIDTERHGILDVSEDISDGSLSLAEKQMSTFNFSLLNHRRKYDGVFTPNDRIHVQMKRITWIPIFSGYLDEVPYASVYPRKVSLKASCTLKRIKYRFWDAGSEAATELLRNASIPGAEFEQQDGGLRDKIIAVLTEVGDWPRQNIHIGMIPDEWADRLEPLREALEEEIGISTDSVGLAGAVNGRNAASMGTRFLTPEGPGTGLLPQMRGKAGVQNFINRELELTAPERGGPGGPGTSDGFNDEWYVIMRWPYRQSDLPRDNPDSKHLSPENTTAAMRWWKNRKILVVNPQNNRGVVLRAVDWGPDPSSQYDVLMSGRALRNVLQAEPGTSMEIRFADEHSPLGPLMLESPGNQDPGSSGSSAGEVFPAQPEHVDSASGLRFTSRNNLRPHVAAAYDFIKRAWEQSGTIGGFSDRNIEGTNRKSDHAKGLALDVHVCSIGSEPTEEQIAFGNSVAQWFASNPDVFDVNYIIWRDRINSGKGWTDYRSGEWRGGGQHPDPTQGHRDHVHISFNSSTLREPGPMGNPWPGATDPRLTTTVSGPGVVPTGAGFGSLFEGSGPLLGAATDWVPVSDPWSAALSGPLTLLNDTSLYETVAKLCEASMRSYMSAPNGDFIAWFPDYFGQYGTAGVMVVRDIELLDDGFTIAWSDKNLVTHQFTAGVYHGLAVGGDAGGIVTIHNKLDTRGIATVEFPELMRALFNVPQEYAKAKYFRDAEAILDRFGARPNYRPLNMILSGDAEFWWAVHLLQRSWASQFSTRVNLSFMPEVYPGMLLRLESHDLQVYVTAVTHSFDMETGFSTQATVIAPSATDRSGLYGLPLAGDVKPRIPASGGGALKM